jgi:hypothetical protein
MGKPVWLSLTGDECASGDTPTKTNSAIIVKNTASAQRRVLRQTKFHTLTG